jgi:hypothetical protein
VSDNVLLDTYSDITSSSGLRAISNENVSRPNYWILAPDNSARRSSETLAGLALNVTPYKMDLQTWVALSHAFGGAGVSPTELFPSSKRGPGQDLPIREETSAPLETPLPAALPLFVTGLAAVVFIARRRKQKPSHEV